MEKGLCLAWMVVFKSSSLSYRGVKNYLWTNRDLTRPDRFFLNTLPAPLVHLLLADVQLASEILECVVIPDGADLEALLEDLDLLRGPFAASADRVATLVDWDIRRA